MRKLSVVIADDDHIVLQNLKTLIDWEKLGFTIVGTCTSGEETLTALKSLHPNILITDVCMMGMNGLDVIDKATKEYPEMKYIVISSYEDFQYVKRAIQNDVADYILKTELNAAKLMRILEKVKKSFNSESALSYLSVISALSGFFNSRDTHTVITDFPSLSELQDKRYLFLAITKAHSFSRLTTQEYKNDISSIRELIWESLTENCAFPLLFLSSDFFIAALDTSSLSAQPNTVFHNFFHSLTFRLQDAAHPYLFFFSTHPMDLSSFHRTYIKDYELMCYMQYFYPASPLIDMDIFRQKQYLPVQETFSFHSLILDEEHLEEDILTIKRYITASIISYNIDSIQNFYQNFCTYIEISTNNQLVMPEKLHAPEPEHFQKWIFNRLFDCIHLLTRGSKFAYNPIVDEAIHYMTQNCSNCNLTAIDIASHVGLSANRLGVLLKKDTGETVNEYLNKIRVNKAIELLEKSNLKIYEITDKCGYKSSQYFSQVILQKTGKRPIDYRRTVK